MIDVDEGEIFLRPQKGTKAEKYDSVHHFPENEH